MKKRLAALMLCGALLCNSNVYASSAELNMDETAGTVLEETTETSETTEQIESSETVEQDDKQSAFPELDDDFLTKETETVETETVEEPVEEPTEVTTTEVDTVIEKTHDISASDLPSYTMQSLCAEFAIDDKPWLQGGYRVIWIDGLPFYIAISDSFDNMLDRIMTAVRANPDSTWAIMKCDSDLDVESISKAAEIYEVDDVFILRYDSEKVAKKDTKKLDRRVDVDFAEVDTEMQIETNTEATTEMNIQPRNLIVATATGNTKTVAVLDTGVNPENDSSWLFDGINLTEENNVADGNGHGTLMSKIIREYSMGSAKILPVKIANDKGEATLLSAFLGIKYAEEHDADIINLSMVTADSVESKCLEYAINDAKNAQVVVSAGNQGSDVKYVSPANVEGAIVVSAVENDGAFAKYSNSGKTIDISAPGSYKGQSGTSCAAAIVSGLLCNKTYEELVASGQDLGDKGWDELYGGTTVGLEKVSGSGTSAGTHEKNSFAFDSCKLLAQVNRTAYGGGNYGYFWAGVQYADGSQISSYKVTATIHSNVTEIGQYLGDVYTLGYPIVGRDGMSWLSETCEKQWGEDTLASSGWGWTYSDGAEVSIGAPWTFDTRQYVWYFPLNCTKVGYHVSNITVSGVQTSFCDLGNGNLCVLQDTNGLGVTNNLGGWYHNTLTCTLSPNTYTMTINENKYNPQTGQWEYFNTRTETATYGSAYTPSYSTPTGYYNHSRDCDSGWTVTGDKTFTVSYYPNTYTMTMYHKYYDPESDSWVDFATTTASALYNSVYTPPYSNTPSGYHNGGRDWDGGWTVTGDGGFNVYYSPNTYKCYFNANGGTVSNSDPLTFTFNSRNFCLGCAPSASRTGFTFLGWYDSAADSNDTDSTANGQQVFDTSSNWSGQNTGVANWGGWLPDSRWYNGLRTARWVYAADATVYAQWKRNQYTVTYDCKTNGGTTDNFTKSVYYDYDIDFTPTAEKNGDTGVYSNTNKDGWVFVGWNTNKNATTGMSSMKMPTKNVTLYAIYKKTITAKFKQYEYTGSSTTANVTSVFNYTHSATVYNNTTTATLTENEVKNITGWKRNGWTTGTTENAALTTNFEINQDTQYYARYSRYVSATFIFGSTKSTLGGTRYRNSYSINTSAPIKITIPAMKAKTSWNNRGWTTATAYNAKVTNNPKTAYGIYDYVTFYSVYSKTVKLSFDVNGGEGSNSSESRTAYYNTSGKSYYPRFTIRDSIHKNAVSFSNWNTMADGTGKAYVAQSTTTLQDSLTLYAAFSNIDVSAVTLDATSLSLIAGDSKTITATVTPGASTRESIIYVSEDEEVATVDSSGVVTGVSAGTTTVVARSASNPDVKAECKVVVSSGSVSVPEKMVLGTQGKITVKSTDKNTTAKLYLSSLSNLVGTETGKEYALVFDTVNNDGTTETKEIGDILASTTDSQDIYFVVHTNIPLSSLLSDKYNATVKYKFVLKGQ